MEANTIIQLMLELELLLINYNYQLSEYNFINSD